MMWNPIRAVVLGALVLATGACATVQPQAALPEPLAIIAASVLVDPDQAATVVREAIEARRAEPTKITAVAVMCAPRHEAAIVSAALRAAPDDATAIREAALWAVKNRTSIAMSIPRAEDIARVVDRAIR
jgi:hypothetical protein